MGITINVPLVKITVVSEYIITPIWDADETTYEISNYNTAEECSEWPKFHSEELALAWLRLRMGRTGEVTEFSVGSTV